MENKECTRKLKQKERRDGIRQLETLQRSRFALLALPANWERMKGISKVCSVL